MKTTYAVIPVQAGIQQDKYSAKRTIIGFVPLMKQLTIRLSWQRTQAKSLVIRRDYSINWIPACAGMTGF